MGKNKQFAIFVLILCLVGIAAIKAGVTSKKPESKEEKIKITKVKSEATLEKGKIDVNRAEIKDMVAMGISLKIAETIVEYRDKTGYIENIEELDCLSGVGAKTMEKLRESLYAGSLDEMKKIRVNINKISEKELGWIGLNKKEIKAVSNWKSANGDISSNLDLLKIVGEERYQELKDKVVYQNY